MPSPFTTILTTFAVTVSAVEDSILYGAIPFALALANEALRVWASSTTEPEAL